jgi:uncharacterized membrane protein YeiH
VEVQARDVLQLAGPHDADAQRIQAPAVGGQVVALQHDHVAAVAAVAGSKAGGGGGVLHRGHHLQ